ncbi:hypothetical protein CLU79DRAFT_753954 [Phycomyces nitens]|nr:hypothetical protein CLU79DRAFT_753954 [Phycomyces nitens]
MYPITRPRLALLFKRPGPAVCTRNSSSYSSSSSSSNNSDNRNQKSRKPLIASQRRSNQANETHAQTEQGFMPIVDIPTNEFAHNTFFSMHMPLMGLEENQRRSFMSQFFCTPEEQEANQVNAEDAHGELVARHMMGLEPFNPPAPPGTTSHTSTTTFTISMEELASMSSGRSSLFFLRENEEMIDYLTAMHDKLKAQEEQARAVSERMLKNRKKKKLGFFDSEKTKDEE